MDDKQKNRIYKRVQKHFTERRTPEEQRELRMRSGMRKAAQGGRRRRHDDFDDDEVAGMERMGRRRKGPAPTAPRDDGPPPRGVLSRPDPHDPRKELVIATGIDVAVVVVTLRTPPLRPGLIDRFLVALERGGVAPLICANKIDMHDRDERAELRAALAPYAALGVPVVYCSAAEGEGIDALRTALRGTTCAFVGHSGVGKSSLLNALDEGARRTGAVRTSDGRGRHTTTTTTFATIGDDTRVILYTRGNPNRCHADPIQAPSRRVR